MLSIIQTFISLNVVHDITNSFTNSIKELDINLISKGKFDWMAPDKEKGLMIACLFFNKAKTSNLDKIYVLCKKGFLTYVVGSISFRPDQL